MSWLLYVFLSGKLIGIIELPEIVETYQECKLMAHEFNVLRPNQTFKCVKGKLNEI